MNKLFIILLASFFYISSITAQSLKDANYALKTAQKAADAGELEKAHESWLKAASIFETNEKWDAYFECGLNITNNLLQAEELEMALDYGMDFIQKSKELKEQNLSVSLIYKSVGKVYYYNNDFKSALPYLENAKNIRESIQSDDPELAKDYYNLGVISRYSERYARAVEFLEKAVALQKDKNVLARIYTELGTNYKLTGNYRKSLDNINQALRILEKENDVEAMATAYFEKGGTLTELKQEREDLKYLQKALDLFLSPELNDRENSINCYRQIAYSYSQFAKISKQAYWNKALEAYEKALQLAEESSNYAMVFTISNDMASVYTNINQLARADSLIQKGNSIQKQHSELQEAPYQFHQLDIHAYRSISAGNYKEAINTYQNQLQLILQGYSPTSTEELPNLQHCKSAASYDQLTDVVAYMARAWYQYYKYGGKDIKNLKNGLKTIQLFDQLIDLIRSDFSTSGSNIAWSDISLDAYENAIEICLALEEATKEVTYKEQALYYSEKSKGLSLLETFQNTKAKTVAGLSEKELIKERELKLDIVQLEQEAFYLIQEENEENAAKIEAIKSEIFDKKEALNQFIKQLEQNNPAYYQTKYQLNILNLEQIRALLKSGQGMLEYFVGDSSIYAFKITEEAFEVYALGGLESMEFSVSDLRNGIYGFFLNSKDRNQQMLSKYSNQFCKRSYQLYQQLIQPLGVLPDKLIIVPAGPMCDMPFEVLLTSPATSALDFHEHEYLLKKHSISYTYSATLLKEMKAHQSNAEKIFLGFAPSFGSASASVIRGKRYALSPLTYNKPEIEAVNDLLGNGTIFEDEAATEAQFKKLAADYKIIHFATHGMANSNDPDYSLLAFTNIDDDKENEFLYVGDMYNLDLNAEMIVLSACETALGKKFRGEGVMSLARGFSYAGAQSIFTTLWCVNDQSTFKIIKKFYMYLQQGLDKDIALQKAKKDFISSSKNIMVHPFLWAPYIIIGDSDRLDSITQQSINDYLIVGFIAFLMLAVGWRIQRKLKNKA